MLIAASAASTAAAVQINRSTTSNRHSSINQHSAILMSRPIYRNLYGQVLFGILLGIVFGIVAPEKAAAMKPLGDGFIKLIKMLIAPIVFATITVGIARMGAMRDVGRIGIRTLGYFEVVSSLALVIGLVVV